MINSRMFTLKLKREKTNPSIDEIHRMRTNAGATMMIVFRKNRAISAWFQAEMKLSNVSVFGNET
jgi:hypothetical protein